MSDDNTLKNPNPNAPENILGDDLDHLNEQIQQNKKFDDIQTLLPPPVQIDMRGYQLNQNQSPTQGGSKQNKTFTILYKNSKKQLTGKNFKDVLEKYHKSMISNIKKTHFTFSIQNNHTKEVKKYEATKEKIRHPVYKYKTIVNEVKEKKGKK